MTHPLFRRIGIIETNEHLSFVHPRKVLVEKCSFRVANVEITTGFGRESGDNLTLDGTLQTKSEARCSLGIASLVGFCSSIVGEQGLSGIQRFEM